ncbi:MAG: hypothetical protein RIA65_01325, partial [Woeseia sp.]
AFCPELRRPHVNTKEQELRTERCYEEAGVWIAKLDKVLSAVELRNLREWLAADPQNRVVFLELACLWDRMNVLSKFPQGLLDRDEGSDAHCQFGQKIVKP